MASKLHEAKNFFKHADKDPEEALGFHPEINDYFLLDACELYEIYTGNKNPHFAIFRGWFNAKYPHLLNSPSSSMIKNLFGENKLAFYSRCFFQKVTFPKAPG
ncbi:MAG: hypothetical protein A2036_03850 [Omnitrophica bacterium GWA2_50_21]|nr:MAG: hypothetical protein A2036_03850 [Omnitrophica bacterium GWA2_50_21]